MIKNLTFNAIHSFLNEPASNEDYILQVLEEPTYFAEGLYKIQVSDGFSKSKKGYLISEAASSCNEIKKFDIIKCQKYNDEQLQQKGKLFISYYSIVYSNIGDVIGKPIDYKYYKLAQLNNSEGSTDIPSQYWNRNAQIIQQSQKNFNKQNIQQSNNNNNNSFQTSLQYKQANNQATNNYTVNNANQNQKPFPQNSVNNQNRQSLALNQRNQKDEKDLDGISKLNPLCSGSFKARVVKKGELKKFTDKLGNSSSCFSTDVVDNEGFEATIQFFGEQANKFDNIIKVGFIFVFRNTSVRVNSNKQYNKGNHIVTINKDSTITEASDDGSVPKIKLNKKTVADSLEMNKNDTIDLVCIIKEVTECKLTQPKDIVIFDESLVETEVILWGENAENENTQVGDVIVIKDARIGEYNQKKQIHVSFSSAIFIKPDSNTFPEVKILQEWYREQSKSDMSQLQKMGRISEGSNLNYNVTTQEQCLQFLKDEIAEQEVFKEIRAQILHIKDNIIYYNSCTKCKKKANQNDDGTWSCSKQDCEMKNANQPDSKYIIQFLISDATETLWVSGYNEVGQQILGRSANDFRKADDEQDPELKRKYIESAVNKEYRFLLLTKSEKMTNDNKLIIKTIVSQIKNDTKPTYEAKKILNTLDKCLSQMQ